MSRTRITVNLIDADGCTFNANYRQRILTCIDKYQNIIEEYSSKEKLTAGESELMAIFTEALVDRQKKFSLKDVDYKKLLIRCEEGAKIFGEVAEGTILDKRALNLLISGYIYYFIKCMELACHDVLGAIFQFSNKVLIQKIKIQVVQADQVVFMLGSNRQCYSFDEVNSKDKGTASIYKELDSLVKHLNDTLFLGKIKLDKFSLADLYDKDSHSGKHFKKILNGELPGTINAFDKNKINIIYAFLHRIAKKHENSDIVVNLWDDLESIIKIIKRFYTENSDLLQHNVQLNLCRYNGKLQKTKTLSGTGVIDQNYKQNTVLMAAMCGYDPAAAENQLNIAESLNVADFRQNRITGWEVARYESGLTLFSQKKVNKPPQETKSVMTLAHL